MGDWNITGYSARGRQSLTYNLKASQFRSMGRPHIFTANTYIQNNYYGNMGSYNYGYDYGCCGHHDCGGGGMSKFTQWMTGIAMGLPLIGNILEMFMPQKAPDGEGGLESEVETQDQSPQDEIDALKAEIADLKKQISSSSAADGDPDADKDVGTGNGDPKVASKGPENDDGAAPKVEKDKLPRLFQDMDAFTTQQGVLDGFKKATNTDAYSIEDAIKSGNSITLTAVQDHGNSTSKTLNLSISAAQLEQLKKGETVTLGNGPDGHPVTAENLDGYIRITAGPDRQTYILGKDGNAHQYKLDANEGNVTGYTTINWGSKANNNSASGTPKGWERKSNLYTQKVLKSEDILKDSSAAKLVVEQLITGMQLNKAQISKLLKLVIKKNPSVFTQNDVGNLKDGANLTLLDLPTKEWIKNNIK